MADVAEHQQQQEQQLLQVHQELEELQEELQQEQQQEQQPQQQQQQQADLTPASCRPGSWSETETNALLDAWADRDIQDSLALAPHEQACVYERVRDRLVAALPGSQRSSQDCRLRIRKLKMVYAKSRKAVAQAQEQGTVRLSRSPYYEKLDKVLGHMPIAAGVVRGGRGSKGAESSYEELDEFDVEFGKVGIDRFHEDSHVDFSSGDGISSFLQDAVAKPGGSLWKPWDVRETSALLDVWLAPDMQAALVAEPRGGATTSVYGRVRDGLVAALPDCRRTPHECRARIKKLKMMYAKARRVAAGQAPKHGADRFTHSQLFDKMDRVLGRGQQQQQGGGGGGGEAETLAVDDADDDEAMASEGFLDSPMHQTRSVPQSPATRGGAGSSGGGACWSVSETNALLDVWAEDDIQAMLASPTARNNACVYDLVRDRLAAASPPPSPDVPPRSSQDCRLRIKKLKTVYAKSRKGVAQAQEQGTARASKSPYYEKLDRVLGHLPVREANGTAAARVKREASAADVGEAASMPAASPAASERRGVKRHGSPGDESEAPGKAAAASASASSSSAAGVEELVSTFLRLEERRERRERELEARLTRLYMQWEERRRREDRAFLAALAAMQAQMQDKIVGLIVPGAATVASPPPTSASAAASAHPTAIAAVVTPAEVTPAAVTPATVNPAEVTPAEVTP
ncbi:uncharacterized protein LOC133360473 [Lethenteron reissneri]|uniref:uncharacterized protein LOC133360473 n=1 Tax=Lethenteron reissneri TaxID=7753 RepID=UPI002AB75879|nr:uncharacterized protein LOC133360473 [Lethenteron reissneri]XP_061435201.1 uncharacterized protein LOC133360473 [Lethenteron reissneri]